MNRILSGNLTDSQLEEQDLFHLERKVEDKKTFLNIPYESQRMRAKIADLQIYKQKLVIRLKKREITVYDPLFGRLKEK